MEICSLRVRCVLDMNQQHNAASLAFGMQLRQYVLFAVESERFMARVVQPTDRLSAKGAVWLNTAYRSITPQRCCTLLLALRPV